MQYKPHRYQEFAKEHIIRHAVAALFLDMGLGKTVITLTAIKELMYERFEIQKVLVIAPLRVARDTWPAEIRKWDHLAGLTYAVAVGSQAERLAALRSKADIHIINRENVTWLVEESGLPFDYDLVVIDELSSFKSYRAKRFKSLLSVRRTVKRIVGLTGTPSSNGLMDLWAQFRLLDLGERLVRYISRYRERYFLPDKRNAQVVFTYKLKPGAEEQIYHAISDITISMKAEDYLDLPPCIHNVVKVALSEREREVYERFRKEMVISLGGEEIDAMNAAALSNKLLQMANGAVYDDRHTGHQIHERKLDALEDLIEAANGRPVMVCYWFRHDLERIRRRFPAVRELKTAKDIEDWNAGKIPVALVHPASAGHGLNLQYGGCTLVWFGLTWSLELYQQTNKRLHRQGQRDTVVIHHIVADGTIDELVLAALHRKDKTQAALIAAVKAVLEV